MNGAAAPPTNDPTIIISDQLGRMPKPIFVMLFHRNPEVFYISTGKVLSFRSLCLQMPIPTAYAFDRHNPIISKNS